MKTLVALLALLAVFGFIGLFGAALAVGPCAGQHRSHRTRPGAAESRAEAVKALIDGLRRANGAGADDGSPRPDGVGAVLLFDDPGAPRGAPAPRPVGGVLWEVR